MHANTAVLETFALSSRMIYLYLYNKVLSLRFVLRLLVAKGAEPHETVGCTTLQQLWRKVKCDMVSLAVAQP